MSRSDLCWFLRECLVEHCFLDDVEAKRYSGHSARAGGATEFIKTRIPRHIIMGLAGVTSEGWIATYDRVSLDRRLAVSSSFGF